MWPHVGVITKLLVRFVSGMLSTGLIPDPFRIILPKAVRCEDDSTEDLCGNLTVFSYRGADGVRYIRCQPCLRRFAQRCGAATLLALI